MLNYASAATSGPFRNIIAHKPVVPSDGRKKKEKEKGTGNGKARKKDEQILVPRASIKRIAERSISLIISEKGGTRASPSSLSLRPRDADGAAKLIFKRDCEASVRGVRSAL